MEAIDGKYVAQDAAPGAPDQLIALARLAKPGIVAAVLLAGYAGMATAARGVPGQRTTILCLAALLLSAAGSAMMNSLFDLPLDRRMGRLSNRVRALDAVGPVRLLLTALTCITAALLLATLLNRLVLLLTVGAVIMYALVYTLILKRRSPWGAVFGGMPGALPALIGQAAVKGSIDSSGIILFTIVFLWQPPHFWLLALRCREEYRAAGIPVLPLVCGEPYTKALVLLYATALLPATLALTATGVSSPLFAAVASGLWLYLLGACCRHALFSRRFERAFGASLAYLTAFLAAVILDVFLR